MGYAESVNGIYFDRKDEEVGITVSSSGWDSETVCYPYVIDLKENDTCFTVAVIRGFHCNRMQI